MLVRQSLFHSFSSEICTSSLFRRLKLKSKREHYQELHYLQEGLKTVLQGSATQPIQVSLLLDVIHVAHMARHNNCYFHLVDAKKVTMYGVMFA